MPRTATQNELVLTLRDDNPRAADLCVAYFDQKPITHEGRAYTITEALPVHQDGTSAWVFGLRPQTQ